MLPFVGLQGLMRRPAVEERGSAEVAMLLGESSAGCIEEREGGTKAKAHRLNRNAPNVATRRVKSSIAAGCHTSRT
eukprot:3624898-Amphidinium_carterae.1